MLSRAVRLGSRLNFWKTNPTVRLRMRVRSGSVMAERSLSPTTTFPVVGGSIQTTLPPNGHVNHRGGIKLFKLTGGTAVKISNFNINLAARSLTGILNNNPAARIKIFSLGLVHANFNPGVHSITVSNITVSLTGAAANALNSALGVPLFHGGQVIGIMKTHVVI